MYFPLWSILLFTAFSYICLNIIYTLKKRLMKFSGISDIEVEIKKLYDQWEQEKIEQAKQFENRLAENQALAVKKLHDLEIEQSKIEQKLAMELNEATQKKIYINNDIKNNQSILYELTEKIEKTKIDLISMDREEFILDSTVNCSKQFIVTMNNLKTRIDQTIRQKSAWDFGRNISFNDVQFKAMATINVFDSICGFAISRITTTNIIRLEMMINSAFHNLNSISEPDFAISFEYCNLKMEEIALYFNYINKNIISFERC